MDLAQQENRGVVISAFYEYYKGGIYKTKYIARHTETKEILVIYQNEKDQTVWACPKDIFLEALEIEGKNINRFELLISREKI